MRPAAGCRLFLRRVRFVVRKVHEVVGAYGPQEPRLSVRAERLTRHDHPVDAEGRLHDAVRRQRGYRVVRARGERIGVVVAVAVAEYLADEVLSSHSRPPHQARPWE